jgi:hypothetical protein
VTKTPSSFLCGNSSGVAAALRAVTGVLVLAYAAAAAPAGDTARAAPDSTAATGPSFDTSSEEPPSDTMAAALLSDSVRPAAAMTTPSGKKDSTKAAIRDSFNVRAGTILGGGVGLSIGSIKVFTLWNNGLPQSLADLGLKDTSFRRAGDTLLLTFTTKQAPDVYNMTFPLAVGLGRLSAAHRCEAAVSFSMLSKNFRSAVAVGSASSSGGRIIDISQSIRLYAVTLDLLYGKAIPERYLTIAGADRTDGIAGVSLTPFVGVSTTTGISAPVPSDLRLQAVRDSVARGLHQVSASGIAFGWRMGIAKMRHLSKNGCIEGRLCYCGAWTTAFRKTGGMLTEKEIGSKSNDPDKRV